MGENNITLKAIVAFTFFFITKQTSTQMKKKLAWRENGCVTQI